MVLNDSELGGGSIRIHNIALQMAAFKILGTNESLASIPLSHVFHNQLCSGYFSYANKE